MVKSSVKQFTLKAGKSLTEPKINDREIINYEVTRKHRSENDYNFRDLLENANDLIQSVNINGNFIYVNRKWLKTLGYTKEEVERLKLTDILREDQIPHCMEIFKKVCKGESFEHIETVFISKNLEEIFVEGNANPRFEDGKFVQTLGIFRNITERRQMEIQIRESEEKFKEDVDMDKGV